MPMGQNVVAAAFRDFRIIMKDVKVMSNKDNANRAKY